MMVSFMCHKDKGNELEVGMTVKSASVARTLPPTWPSACTHATTATSARYSKRPRMSFMCHGDLHVMKLIKGREVTSWHRPTHRQSCWVLRSEQ